LLLLLLLLLPLQLLLLLLLAQLGNGTALCGAGGLVNFLAVPASDPADTCLMQE
jgi:hypothetical protein